MYKGAVFDTKVEVAMNAEGFPEHISALDGTKREWAVSSGGYVQTNCLEDGFLIVNDGIVGVEVTLPVDVTYKVAAQEANPEFVKQALKIDQLWKDCFDERDLDCFKKRLSESKDVALLLPEMEPLVETMDKNFSYVLEFLGAYAMRKCLGSRPDSRSTFRNPTPEWHVDRQVHIRTLFNGAGEPSRVLDKRIDKQLAAEMLERLNQNSNLEADMKLGQKIDALYGAYSKPISSCSFLFTKGAGFSKMPTADDVIRNMSIHAGAKNMSPSTIENPQRYIRAFG